MMTEFCACRDHVATDPLDRCSSRSLTQRAPQASGLRPIGDRKKARQITVLSVISTWAIVVLALGGVLLIAGMVMGCLVVHGRKNPGSSVNALFEKL